MLNREKIGHEKLRELSTSPVRCSHFTLGIQQSHFQQYHSYILLIIYVIAEGKKTVTHLATTPENVTTLTCEMQSFFIRLKVLLHSFKCLCV